MEIGIESFEAWSGGVDTKNRIIECDMCNEFDNLIEETYPNGMTDTELNDLLWFSDSWIYDMLGINEEDEDENEDVEEDEE